MGEHFLQPYCVGRNPHDCSDLKTITTITITITTTLTIIIAITTAITVNIIMAIKELQQ